MSTESLKHITVLLDEAVAALVQNPDGFYVDGTFGRGGHSALVLNQLSPAGRLMAIDKDLEAIACAHTRFADDARFDIAHGSFSRLQEFVTERGMFGQVDGVLLDLGVSSPQLDDPMRGFSFQHDGPLDMRMDTTSGESVAQWIMRASQDEIADVIYTYGEDRHGRRMAKAVVEARAIAPIETTAQLAKIISDANPSWEKGKHPATRAFQAFRIHINRELEDLEKCLDQSLDSLKVGGRLVIISFHSLEDRIVKRFIRKHVKGDDHLPMSIPVTSDMLKQRLKAVGKMVKASATEVDENPRSRSAVMRIATKIA